MGKIQTKDTCNSSQKIMNPTTERFCQLVATACFNQSDRIKAYWGAGYKANSEEQAELSLRGIMSREDVKARIAFLRDELYDIYKPDKEYFRALYQDIIDNAPVNSPTRLKAIQSMQDLAEIGTNKSGNNNGITLVFNGTESNSMNISKL